MTDNSLLAGPALRRLRKREGMTQSSMAAALGISPSYLNLIERNQRPLSARVLVQVIDRFDFDPRTLREEESIGGIDGLARRLADERFADLNIDREEVSELLNSAPQAAAAFARLYDRSGQEVGGVNDSLNVLLPNILHAFSMLEGKGYSVESREVNEGFGWTSWRTRTDALLKTFFAKKS